MLFLELNVEAFKDVQEKLCNYNPPQSCARKLLSQLRTKCSGYLFLNLQYVSVIGTPSDHEHLLRK